MPVAAVDDTSSSQHANILSRLSDDVCIEVQPCLEISIHPLSDEMARLLAVFFLQADLLSTLVLFALQAMSTSQRDVCAQMTGTFGVPRLILAHPISRDVGVISPRAPPLPFAGDAMAAFVSVLCYTPSSDWAGHELTFLAGQVADGYRFLQRAEVHKEGRFLFLSVNHECHVNLAAKLPNFPVEDQLTAAMEAVGCQSSKDLGFLGKRGTAVFLVVSFADCGDARERHKQMRSELQAYTERMLCVETKAQVVCEGQIVRREIFSRIFDSSSSSPSASEFVSPLQAVLGLVAHCPAENIRQVAQDLLPEPLCAPLFRAFDRLSGGVSERQLLSRYLEELGSPTPFTPSLP